MEYEFNPRLVDELFERRTTQEITDTIAGMGRSVDGSIDRSRFSNTAIAVERLIGHKDYRQAHASDPHAPYGRFRGRHIIGTGTRVLGGVYLGHRPREAITLNASSPFLKSLLVAFVDDRLNLMRTKLLRGDLQFETTHEGVARAFVQDLPQDLFTLTMACLPYDERKTAEVFRAAKLEPDAELSLDVYLEAKTGVCRHMVLFLVGVFELLSKMGLTQGTMSVCRCYIPNLFSHAWARFELEGTEPIILDPAQNFFGTLEKGGEMGKFVYDHELAKFLSAE
ncbi:hypothetical protein A3C09_03200 [Candidatus Uhrbacteria bacterium RIFCSPHIGHO2_02_FULL_47_44]|uniref:Uncharacterized protein n=1 Tax=Candidatus Uhrbacteria bacterium RIFCSPLOWO2_02_FULL_48_18 TaxID=1802408 RepID=A0A1F7V7X0_9BACT|nr:MAG: hypothetical protein A3C09_03200 [Candidatus Uhrbacteria bacterium RIFCSPHIGHO2_02_FULL_47_44]OGL76980.1 MAG: hypothetical protein A3E97_05255 [Candidatus Uhrbacteria bacterium RIFCSPHIGHO2_12_FULL_47_12]OGL80758.1 MAG: hypothetical protein A3B20_05220 [Candidatus Uhrbacteria bacterium RIFCSPLOWO2_01_FULL_47_17]OGL86590.1 MAG: hypothetical protein A3I41_04880 [Candidatus Uhrbacteria bacterium RIFCSPLOWO2_02_FULL_48_18]OGL92585.1 MAG: hypothetical protein A3H12_02430 [Candidatus Uhrbacte